MMLGEGSAMAVTAQLVGLECAKKRKEKQRFKFSNLTNLGTLRKLFSFSSFDSVVCLHT